MFISKCKLYFHSVRYMKPIQIFWKIWLKLSRTYLNHFVRKVKPIPHFRIPVLQEQINFLQNIHGYSIFNESVDLSKINWKLNKDDALFQYHLHYHDYLSNLDKESGLKITHDWIEKNPPSLSVAWDPYTISLRVVNWVKFISRFHINDSEIINSLFLQGIWLFYQREYHLLANHFFKNIVALLYLGFVFKNRCWSKWANKNLLKQISEQLTNESYHFEFSPTYHALFVKDLLDVYNLLINNEKKDSNLTQNISDKIEDGLFWLFYYSKNEKYFQINDVNYEGCPKPSYLRKYASKLGIKEEINISSSISQYYPKLESGDLRIMMYCAPISPYYNPAHSHADMLSILLWYNNEEILVDTGNYDYEESDDRRYARSTSAHNTIVIDGKNQCDLWKVFRVGRRGKLFDKDFREDYLQCSHDSYKKFNLLHTRRIEKTNKGFIIQDLLKGKGCHKFEMLFHFSPEVNIKVKGEEYFMINKNLMFKFSHGEISIIDTSYFPELFIKKEKQTVRIYGEFKNKITLKTKISEI